MIFSSPLKFPKSDFVRLYSPEKNGFGVKIIAHFQAVNHYFSAPFLHSVLPGGCLQIFGKEGRAYMYPKMA